ncbi:hypothetical protein TNCV_1708641 [Trichonephila clavipes]|nr:hypothetical protein TNCV_1708641 [Trichonephila clavipes]
MPTRFLYAWTIPNFSELRQKLDGEDLLLPNGKYCLLSLTRNAKELRLSMKSSSCFLTCSVTIFNCNGMALIFREPFKNINMKEEFYYSLLHLNLNKLNLRDLPENVLFIVFSIFDTEMMENNFSTYQDGSENGYLNYFRELATDIKKAPDDILKEKVTLRVGDDTEVGDKAVFQITSICKDVRK